MGLSNAVFEFIARNGSIGVDIFFVISGYVMAKTTYGSAQNLDVSFRFISKRFARIYLGYWPIFMLALIIYTLHRPKFLVDKELFQSFLLINSNTLELLIAPAWSLTYELYFYLIVGLILCSRWFRPIPFLLLLSLLAVLKVTFSKTGIMPGKRA